MRKEVRDVMANSRVLTARFELVTPDSLTAVLSALSADAQRSALLFGGTDLLVQMKMGKRAPDRVINCRWLAELQRIDVNEDTFEIGAGTSLQSVADHTMVAREFPALLDAIESIAGPAIRRMGTIGGNVVNASPAADSVVALVACRARFRLKSTEGERTVDAEPFFVAPGRTVKRAEEVLTHILLPRPRGKVSGHFRKVGRVAGDIAKLSVAVTAERSLSGTMTWRVAMGAVAPTPVVLSEVERLLNGAPRIGPGNVDDIRSVVGQSITPIDDVRSTARYRRCVSMVTVSDLCQQVWQELEETK